MPSRRVSGWPMLEPCLTWAGSRVRVISDMQGSGRRREGRGGKRRDPFRRSLGSQRQRAHDEALCELDLEGVVAGRLCFGEGGLRRAAERAGASGRAYELRFRRLRTPRLWRDAAKRKPRLPDGAALDDEPGRGRDDCERIGRALPHLEITRMRGERARG